MLRVLAPAICAAVLGVASVLAQDGVAPAGFQMLRGVVTATDESRAPVRRARVSAVWTDGRPDPVFTDEGGRFELAVPVAASYTLSLAKPGFAPEQIFRDRGLSAGPLDIRMNRGAVVSGAGLDPDGAPVVGLGVVVRRTDPSGEAYGSGGWSTETGDRGEFLVGSLPAGPFAVVLTDRRGVRS